MTVAVSSFEQNGKIVEEGCVLVSNFHKDGNILEFEVQIIEINEELETVTLFGMVSKFDVVTEEISKREPMSLVLTDDLLTRWLIVSADEMSDINVSRDN